MIPKEKAEEFYYRYYQKVADGPYPEDIAKQCALIAIDEMLSLANLMDGGFSFEKEILFLQEVKQEIEKL